MDPVVRRRDRLVREMERDGLWPSRAPWIRRAMTETVPREEFAARRLWRWDGHAYVPVERDVEPERWAEEVYGGPYDPAVTQVSDGVATSSLSCPSVVADMLDSLLLEPGHTVLELGTATGWNAALLATRTGPGRVTSVEIDAELAAAARKKLARAGPDVRVARADGAAGWPEGAPYDRLIATYAIETVPWTWVAQTKPGGRLVTPWGRLGHVALTVAGDGASASGWVQGLATFMPSRSEMPRGRRTVPRAVGSARADRTGTGTGTGMGTRERAVEWDIAPLRDDTHLRFALRVALPEVRIAAGGGELGVRLDDGAGSWAEVRPTGDRGHARYGGPRRLVEEVEHAWERWRAHGSPELYDHGLTVADEGRVQYAWAWDPDTGPRWPVRVPVPVC